jgi:hypothetical protein
MCVLRALRRWAPSRPRAQREGDGLRPAAREAETNSRASGRNVCRISPVALVMTTMVMAGCSGGSAAGTRANAASPAARPTVGRPTAEVTGGFVPVPWSRISRGADSRTLLIAAPEPARSRSRGCRVQYRTRVTSVSIERIRIYLERLIAKPSALCATRGRPTYVEVPVRLKYPYRGQQLFDGTESPFHERPHRLTRG